MREFLLLRMKNLDQLSFELVFLWLPFFFFVFWFVREKNGRDLEVNELRKEFGRFWFDGEREIMKFVFIHNKNLSGLSEILEVHKVYGF